MAYSKCNQENVAVRSREIDQSFAQTGVFCKLGEIILNTQSEYNFIGAVFHFQRSIVLPTQERIDKLHSAIHCLIEGHNMAHNFLHLLGLMASCIELIPNARLYMRPIQLHLLHFWRPVTKDMQMIVPVTQHLKGHLKWWLDIANITQGRSLVQWSDPITITTDASKTGFGGHMKNPIYQGLLDKN